MIAQYFFVISSIGFLVNQNLGLANGILILLHLEAKILKNISFSCGC